MTLQELVAQIGLHVQNPECIPDEWVSEEGGPKYIKTSWNDDTLVITGEVHFVFNIAREVKATLLLSASNNNRDPHDVADDLVKFIMQMVINGMGVQLVPELHSKIVKAIIQ